MLFLLRLLIHWVTVSAVSFEIIQVANPLNDLA